MKHGTNYEKPHRCPKESCQAFDADWTRVSVWKKLKGKRRWECRTCGTRVELA